MLKSKKNIFKEPGENYNVWDMRTEKKVFTGSIEECTAYISDFGIGWTFLYIKDTVVIPEPSTTIKLINENCH